LEVDLLLERFLDRHAGNLDPERLAALNELLALPDPDLWELFSGRRECENDEFAAIVALVRGA